jgi:molybdopterin-guanine dinucleotide biosynthesis protein B
MKIFAFAGISDTGKTHLIQELIHELKHRGYTISVIKHCPHGFQLEPEGKDTAKFVQAGADSACMYSSDGLAVCRQKKQSLDVRTISKDYLQPTDFVLVEGDKTDKGLKKIEVLRKGVSEKSLCSPEELIAIVSDYNVSTDKPVFHPGEISAIADFLETQPREKEL